MNGYSEGTHPTPRSDGTVGEKFRPDVAQAYLDVLHAEAAKSL